MSLFQSVNMFWYDLKLWQVFKTKHKILAKSMHFQKIVILQI